MHFMGSSLLFSFKGNVVGKNKAIKESVTDFKRKYVREGGTK